MIKHPKQKHIEVPMRRNAKHAFIATIKSRGRDEQGREVGTNGIKWKLA